MLIGTLELCGLGYAYAWYDGENGSLGCSGIQADLDASPAGPAPNAVAIRVPFGGCEFTGPAVIDTDVIGRIESLAPQSPLDLKPALELIRKSREWFGACKQVAVFDTAFFAGAAREHTLGSPEYVYAIDPDLSRELNLYRLGYQGILHEAACRHVGWSRILSICLEPRPEIAAIVDGQPVMVTGGVGRLGGLPGEQSCGDIDPTIVLMIAQRLGMSVPQIGAELSENSGFLGLVGNPTSLPELMSSTEPQLQFARDVFERRFRQACGSAVSLMGDVDAVVFSGRYLSLGPQIAEHCLADWIGTPSYQAFTRPTSCVMARAVLDLSSPQRGARA